MNKGCLWEQRVSKKFHDKGIPILISPRVLREMGCGQVDVCVLVKKNNEKKILVIEAKVAGKGISHSQRSRLLRSLEVLSQIFELPTELLVDSPNDAK